MYEFITATQTIRNWMVHDRRLLKLNCLLLSQSTIPRLGQGFTLKPQSTNKITKVGALKGDQNEAMDVMTIGCSVMNETTE
jgi:hypothetical protein